MSSQQTSTPYSLDALQPRDAGLLWAKEFGTNVTSDVGEAFDASAAVEPPPVRSIDARYGMLALNNFPPYEDDAGQVYEPRGASFEFDFLNLVPVQNFANIFGGESARVAVLYAHFLLAEESGVNEPSDQANVGAGLALGTAAMVGDDPLTPFYFFRASAPAFLSPRPAPLCQGLDYFNGGGALPSPGADLTLGTDVYLRLVLTSLAAKPEITFGYAAWSAKGLSWESGLFEWGLDGTLGRIGFFATGPCAGMLDWVRVYDYPLVDSTAGLYWTLTPPATPTGSRLFIP